ncbi:MAG TPA: spore coat protein, partial [Thermaerobacter sp.]
FQRHAHHLRQALGAATPGGGPAGGPTGGVASGPGGRPAGRIAGGFGAPPFPPMRGGAHGERPGRRETGHHGGKGNREGRSSGALDHDRAAGRDAGSRDSDRARAGEGVRMEAGPGETKRADRPELVGWEPGAGNNEGWQAGARREDPRPTPDEASAIRAGRDAGDTRFEASAPLAPQVGTAGERETARRNPGGREFGWGAAGRTGPSDSAQPAGGRAGAAGTGHVATGRGSADAEAFTAVRPPGQPFSFAARQDAPAPGPGAVRVPSGGAGDRPEAASPRVDLAPGVGAGTVPYASQTGYGAQTGHAPRPGHAPQTVHATSAGIADPDALAVADCLKDCKHVAVRLVMAATECADHHLRRTLYQMAGEHLEMAGQHFEWLQRRHLYTVEGAGPQLVQSLEQDIRRLEAAVRVTPPGGPQGAFGPRDFRH